MTANVGEMFWTGEAPWHGRGTKVDRPLTWEEALAAGGLDWRVDEERLLAVSASEVLSPVPARKALVRSDVPAGRPGHVLGAVHDGFVPLQNREGIEAFDRVFGRGRPVYETGGWLGRGEKVWLLARAGDPFEPLRGDRVDLYTLFANSHDGSVAIRVRLTTVRVVCQNTFVRSLAESREEPELRLPHTTSLEAFEAKAGELRQRWDAEARRLTQAFLVLSKAKLRPGATGAALEKVFPFPRRPADMASARTVAAWARRIEETRETHGTIRQLLESGRGTSVPGVRGTLWGLFNAFTEYVDHEHVPQERLGPGWSLIGEGASLKARAWEAVLDLVQAA